MEIRDSLFRNQNFMTISEHQASTGLYQNVHTTYLCSQSWCLSRLGFLKAKPEIRNNIQMIQRSILQKGCLKKTIQSRRKIQARMYSQLNTVMSNVTRKTLEHKFLQSQSKLEEKGQDFSTFMYLISANSPEKRITLTPHQLGHGAKAKVGYLDGTTTSFTSLFLQYLILDKSPMPMYLDSKVRETHQENVTAWQRMGCSALMI